MEVDALMLDESQNENPDDSIAALIGIIDNTPQPASIIPTLVVPVKEAKGKIANKKNLA